MKEFSCPDCGKIFEENSVPSSCPNCGCPSSEFKEKTVITRSVDTITEEKVYYADRHIKITNKLWSFGGYDVINDNLAGVVYFPVSAISSVSIRRYLDWWLFLLLGIIMLVASIFLFNTGEGALIMVGFLLLLVAILFFVVAYRRFNLRKLMIKPHNSYANYSLEVENVEEAKKYLTPMLSCLIENS